MLGRRLSLALAAVPVGGALGAALWLAGGGANPTRAPVPTAPAVAAGSPLSVAGLWERVGGLAQRVETVFRAPPPPPPPPVVAEAPPVPTPGSPTTASARHNGRPDPAPAAGPSGLSIRLVQKTP